MKQTIAKTLTIQNLTSFCRYGMAW